MVGLFRSLFRKGGKGAISETPSKEVAATYEELEKMSLPEILKNIQSFPARVPPDGLAFYIQRLLTIALFDNHIPEDHREAALQLADALTVDMENMASGNPKAVAALRRANQHMRERARYCGYGSLAWRINEYQIPASETIPYIMKPEHRDLVSDCLTIFSPHELDRMKPHMVRELVWQASYRSRNAVLVLHGVVASGDKAAAAIFTPEEYLSLLSVPDDYGAGRSVLEDLGLLSPSGKVWPVERLPNIDDGLALTFNLLKVRGDQSETDGRLMDLPEDRKCAILLTLSFLRIDLVRRMLCQIYEREMTYDMITSFSDSNMIEELNRFIEVSQIVKTSAPGTPVDFALLDEVMARGDIEAKSEEEFDNSRKFYEMAVQWINSERVAFLDRLRQVFKIHSDSGNETDTDDNWEDVIK